MAELKENVIEWYNNESMALVTLNQGRYISRVRKYAKEYPDECEIVARKSRRKYLRAYPVEMDKNIKSQSGSFRRTEKSVCRENAADENGILKWNRSIEIRVHIMLIKGAKNNGIL